MRSPGRWRILLHALDRTGPPMLALAFLRWMATARPEVDLEILAFRGGPLRGDLEALGRVTVVLDHHEPWDVWRPDAARLAELRSRLADQRPVTVNLLVSIAAGQVLPLLPAEVGPIVTWVVEMGEDLHWFDDPIALVERTDVFLAGSHTTAIELGAFLPGERPSIVPEFVEAPMPINEAQRHARRAEMGASPHDMLVLGAGIGTVRKGLDLFAEVAALLNERASVPIVCCWVGGIDDPLYPLVRGQQDRPELGCLVLKPPVPDLDVGIEAADVFLHPARRDAFPLVCISAAASGTPVVAFEDSGGAAELLGVDLVGAPFPDTSLLVDEILRLADPRRRAAVGAAQRARTERHLAPNAAPVLEQAVLRGLVEVGR